MCTVKLLKKLAVFLTLSSFSISNSYLLGCVFSAAVMNDFLSYLAVSTECSDEIDGTVAHSGDHSGSSWNVPQPKIETASVSWEREDFSYWERVPVLFSDISHSVYVNNISLCLCVWGSATCACLQCYFSIIYTLQYYRILFINILN